MQLNIIIWLWLWCTTENKEDANLLANLPKSVWFPVMFASLWAQRHTQRERQRLQSWAENTLSHKSNNIQNTSCGKRTVLKAHALVSGCFHNTSSTQYKYKYTSTLFQHAMQTFHRNDCGDRLIFPVASHLGKQFSFWNVSKMKSITTVSHVPLCCPLKIHFKMNINSAQLVYCKLLSTANSKSLSKPAIFF